MTVDLKKILSIVIPIYNSSKSIERCLLSIKQQNVNKNKIEIIAVDDGSTDDSLEIIKRCKNIKVYHQENKGVGAARNFGIEKAKGKYIWFVDSDDEILPGSITDSWLKKLELSNIDMFLFGTEGRRNGKNFNIVNDREQLLVRGDFSKSLVDVFSKNILNPLWNKMYLRKTIVDNSIRFNGFKVGEDACFNYKVISNSELIQVSTDIKYIYYFDSVTSVKHKYDSDHMKDASERMLLMENMFNQLGIPLKNILYEKEVVDILFGAERNIFNRYNGNISFKEYRELLKKNDIFMRYRSRVTSFRSKKNLVSKSIWLSFIVIKISNKYNK